jgi:hypothetical protein
VISIIDLLEKKIQRKEQYEYPKPIFGRHPPAIERRKQRIG